MFRPACLRTPEMARLAGSNSCMLIGFLDNKIAGADAFSHWRCALCGHREKAQDSFARNYAETIRKNLGFSRRLALLGLVAANRRQREFDAHSQMSYGTRSRFGRRVGRCGRKYFIALQAVPSLAPYSAHRRASVSD